MLFSKLSLFENEERNSIKMREFKDRYVLITGGASGIGFAMAKVLISRNARPIIADNNRELLDKCETFFRNEAIKPVLFNMDLSKCENHILLYNALKQKNIPVEILINNVAISFFGKFTDLKWEELKKIIEVNLICLTHLCHLFIPDMIKRGRGAILNISSTSSLVPCPNIGIYAATKTFVNSLTETLSIELKGTGIKICSVLPGATDTNFFKNAGMDDMEYVKTIKKMSPSSVAEKCLEALLCNKRGETIGLRNKLNMVLSRYMPKSILNEISARRFR
jgi:short-subunit dehydrogenase